MGVKQKYNPISGNFNLVSNQDLNHLGSFTNYNELITEHPVSVLGTLAYTINSQGAQWLPGTWGGNFYSKGTYVWNGSDWVSSVDDIVNEIETLISIVTVNSLITDTKTKIIAVDYLAIANDFVLMTSGVTDKTVTLPLSPTKDDIIEVSKRDNGIGKVIVDGNGFLINDSSTDIIMYQYTSNTYHFDGVQWVKK